MGQLHRRFKEKLRQIKCRLKPALSVSPEVIYQGEYVLEQLRKEYPATEHDNKTIWMYWDTGLTHAPDVVKLSYQSWCQLNPDYKVVLLTNDNLTEYLGFDFNAVFSILSVDLGAAGRSDLLRLYLLNRFGGIWADATTFCIKPLSQWLDISDSGFFCFREKHSHDRTLVSWFLAAKQGNPIVTSLLSLSLDYLTQQRTKSLEIVGLKVTLMLAKGTQLISKENSGFALLKYLESKYAAPYFWLFYLFNEAIKLPQNRQIWQKVLQKHNSCSEMYEDIDSFRGSCVAKQTYRKKYVTSELYQQRENILTELLNAKC
ncbi:capsular polysaccharide synthesis protein [Photobacterium leiognathi]|uniref:capsular polysaccharide synthesis protein n=1 Tax=Photobacterium leiognathi TaxID=553611 RepID=UPI0029812353|nr:capsular polysaccharide synthesis protein [Photobacterium leiognathi]